MVANLQMRKEVGSVYRLMILYVYSTFRATSNDLVLVLAGIIAFDILAREMSALYHIRHMNRCAEYKNTVEIALLPSNAAFEEL